MNIREVMNGKSALFVALLIIASCSQNHSESNSKPPAGSPEGAKATNPQPAANVQAQTNGVATGPSLPDTLSPLKDLDRFYDENPADLYARWAQKLIADGQEAKNFAIQQLGAAGEAGVGEILKVFEDYNSRSGYFGAVTNCCQAIAATKTRDARAIDAMVRALKHESGTVRSEASRTLGILRDPRALQPLKEAFFIHNVEQRKLVVKAIGSLDSPEVDAALFDIISSETVAQAFREAAVQALSLRPLGGAELYLRKTLTMPSPLKEAALIALVPTRDPDILQKARALASDPTTVFCSFASIALAKNGDYEFAIKGLRDADSSVRLLLGLVSIRGGIEAKMPEGELRTKIIEALRARENDENLEVAVEAVRLLIKLGETPEVAEDLRDLQSEDATKFSRALDLLTDLQIADRRATRTIVEKMHAAPMNRKRGFAQALGRLRDPAAVPDLERYLSGPSGFADGIWFCDYAAQQLSNLGEPGFRALERALKTNPEPARRVGLVSGVSFCSEPKKDIAALLRKIAADQAEHPEVRAVAIRYLPLLEKSECVAFLKNCLAAEPNWQIRRLLNSTLFLYF
ncbi:MAG: HEAT repeat domain-containing protein [Planctomycetota bacterium]